MIRKLLVVLPMLAMVPAIAMAAAPPAGDMRGPPVAELASALGLTEDQVTACMGDMAPPAGRPAAQSDADTPPRGGKGERPEGGRGAPPDQSALLACLQEANPAIDAAALEAAMPAPRARN